MCSPDELFGHNYAGGYCTECGRSQVDKPKPAEVKIREPIRGMHSALHALVYDLTEYFHESSKFAAYLGLVKGREQKAREIWSVMKQKGISSGRYFFAAMRKK